MSKTTKTPATRKPATAKPAVCSKCGRDNQRPEGRADCRNVAACTARRKAAAATHATA